MEGEGERLRTPARSLSWPSGFLSRESVTLDLEIDLYSNVLPV